MSEIFISVVIPTCNRAYLLDRCLALLYPNNQSLSSAYYEIIVTDDSRNSESQELIESKYPWVKLVAGPKRGPAANRNNGARYASGNWIVFIDDDCLPELGLLKAYEKIITENSLVSAFEGRIFVDTSQTSFLQESPINNEGGCFWSCNICISSKLFNSLDGFDEKFLFSAMEDVDFFLRLKNNRYSHMFAPDASVLHPWRINENLFETTLKRYEAQKYYLSKHPTERERINFEYYLKAFLRRCYFTLKNAKRFKFSGIVQKTQSDFLQLYFALKTLFLVCLAIYL